MGPLRCNRISLPPAPSCHLVARSLFFLLLVPRDPPCRSLAWASRSAMGRARRERKLRLACSSLLPAASPSLPGRQAPPRHYLRTTFPAARATQGQLPQLRTFQLCCCTFVLGGTHKPSFPAVQDRMISLTLINSKRHLFLLLFCRPKCLIRWRHGRTISLGGPTCVMRRGVV